MNEFILLSLTLVSCYTGMSWLALAMKSHWLQLRVKRDFTSIKATVYRILGAASLCGALVLCLQVDHPSIAFLVWIMSMVVAAKAVGLTLSYRATWLRPLAIIN
jgi:hypothetical protein